MLVTNLRVFCFVSAMVATFQVTHAGVLYLDPMFGVQKTYDIVYGQGLINNGTGLLDLTLDVYRPSNIGTAVPESRPTILWMHGGGWRKGRKEQVMQEDEWVSRGYNLISINYRLLDDNPPPTTGPADPFAWLSIFGPTGIVSEVNASFEDAALALEWIYANADTYGIDTTRVGVAGHSAGAIMALALGNIVPQGSIEPKAVLSVAGALFNITSPYSPGGPPAMLITGEKDNTVPVALVEITRNQMNEVGIMTEYYLQPDVGHQPRWDTIIDGETLSQHGINFLYENLAAVPEATPSVLLATGLLCLSSVWAVRRAVSQRLRSLNRCSVRVEYSESNLSNVSSGRRQPKSWTAIPESEMRNR